MYFVASGAYTGYAPVAPGTAGSALALVIYWIMPEPFSWSLWLLMIVGLSVVGIYAATLAEKEWGEDPPKVVIDEIVGYFVAVLLLPKNIFVMALSFLIFRIFDILKPFPAHRSQRLPGGWGIMADDLIAGLYANGVVRLVLWLKLGSTWTASF